MPILIENLLPTETKDRLRVANWALIAAAPARTEAVFCS